MKNAIKYSLIGCGRISANHIQAASSNEYEIVALCDIIPEKCDALISKCGEIICEKTPRYTDYKKMIEENNFDIVAVATDSESHAEIALYCIDRGINVILEKPMTMSIEDADKIIQLAEEKNVKVSVCLQNRFNIAAQKTKAAMESGRFGKISHGTVHIRWNRRDEYYDQASWRGKWASDGGTLLNQCIHGIDMLLWMMNDEIDEVYGVTSQRFHENIETEDLGVAIIKFKNGSLATIEGTVNVFPSNLEETLYLFGSKGTIKLGGKSTNTLEIWDFADELESDIENKGFVEKTVDIYGNGHSRLYADMHDAVKNNRKPYIDATDGKAALELVLAIYKSQKTGTPVKLPLESFSSLDMTGEFTNK